MAAQEPCNTAAFQVVPCLSLSSQLFLEQGIRPFCSQLCQVVKEGASATHSEILHPNSHDGDEKSFLFLCWSCRDQSLICIHKLAYKHFLTPILPPSVFKLKIGWPAALLHIPFCLVSPLNIRGAGKTCWLTQSEPCQLSILDTIGNTLRKLIFTLNW